jgi:hypothetical protein
MNGVRTRCTAPQVLDYRYYFVIQCAPSTRASIQHAPLQNNRRTASVDPNQMGMCVPRTIFSIAAGGMYANYCYIHLCLFLHVLTSGGKLKTVEKLLLAGHLRNLITRTQRRSMFSAINLYA